MPRPRFDPALARGGLFDDAPRDRAAGAERTRSEDAERRDPPPHLSVSEACERVRGALDGVGPVRVLGEVSNFSARKHWYFSVKDEAAVLNCVMWSSGAARALVRPENGMEVVLEGRLTYYAPAARTQLVVDRIERRGQGTLQQRFEELCRVLRAEGYFDESRKRRLPAHPRRVAVVTARHGAALQDVVRTARLRAPWVGLLVVEVPVQGEGAAAEVAAAIRAVDRRADELGIDAMIVTRGGGSLEDLWAFNERVVADAVFACTTPVVAAIGHETDTTIVELVADRRASTPTQAAMLLLPDRAQLAESVDQLADRIGFLVRKRVRDAERDLTAVARHPIFRAPGAMLAPSRGRVDRGAERLATAARGRLERARRRLAEARAAFEGQRPAARRAVAAARLDALGSRLRRAIAERVGRSTAHLDGLGRQLRSLGPQQVLERGYSITTTAEGALVRAAADIPVGAPIVTRLARGALRSTVERIQDEPRADR